MSIFVSVAAYRDPELVSTIQDCLAKADRPDEIRIGLVWQHAGDETIDPIADDPRVTVLDVAAEDSGGVCWARAKAMELYAGETYFMQLDSHHRFVEGWDTSLIADMAKTGSAKPLLTAYLPAYVPWLPTPDRRTPAGIVFDKFVGPVPVVRGGPVDPHEPGEPIPARFVAAGFIFTLGSFVSEVPYDPELYFHGEEISLALRAFTWGYDLFHPSVSMIFHFYERKAQPRHWDDHATSAERKPAWHERNKISMRRVRNLLLGVVRGRYGPGPVRTVAEYEKLSGLNFARCAVRQIERTTPAPEMAGGLRCA
ncbi:MAG: hypothetical protein QOH97_3866 [Actinoplanes sp.]|jgi:hypothetical protein|nr:hypothetical protein [Actinoplanes sp.]